MPLAWTARAFRIVRKKPVSSLALLAGAVLVLLFPFRFGFPWACQSSLLQWLFATSDCTELQKFIFLWDGTAVVWTVFFSIVFFMFEFGSVYKASTTLGIILGMAGAAMAYWSIHVFRWGFDYKLGYGYPDFSYFLFAKLIPMFWLIGTDVLIIAKQDIPLETKNEFRKLLWYIDLPATVAIVILVVYTQYYPPVEDYQTVELVEGVYTTQTMQAAPAVQRLAGIREVSGFASGVAASILLLVNIAFAIQTIQYVPPPGNDRTANQGSSDWWARLGAWLKKPPQVEASAGKPVTPPSVGAPAAGAPDERSAGAA